MIATLLGAARPPAAERLADALERVRASYFSAGGQNCNYGALAGSGECRALSTALDACAQLDPRSLPIPGPLAFWLNAYNAAAILGVAATAVRTSVRDIAGYFATERVRVAGHAFSLDEIEHGLLRGNAAQYGHLRAVLDAQDPRLAFTPRMWDERVHFAFHCACRSAPALRVYLPATLGADLDTAAAEYLGREVELRPLDRCLVVPGLFRWYAEDFGGRDGIVAFVAARAGDESIAEFIDRHRAELRLEYRAYDWSLNTPRREASHPRAT